MENRPPETLLFDLGGVIVDFRGGEGMRAATKGAFDLDFCTNNWGRLPELEQLERGAIAPALFADAFIRQWSLEQGRDAFLDEFKHWVRGVVDGAPGILNGLRSRFRLACLSNLNTLHWDRCVELGVDAFFETRFLSFEMGARKPAPQVYAHVARTLGCAAGDVLFFDDVSANIDAAHAAGMRAHLVENGDIRTALSREGLL